MRTRIPTTRLLAPVLALLLAGCGLDHSVLPGAEANDPDFVQGQLLEREGRPQEALASYLKVINRRGDDAPESHLDAGILYEDVIKDPVAAIYHYRKYRELKPTSPQAELVRGRIEGALREFARTLPADPMANTGGELGATVERLAKENAQLRAQLAKLGVTPTPGGTVSTTTTLSRTGVPSGPKIGAAIGVGPASNDPLIHAAPPPPGSKPA